MIRNQIRNSPVKFVAMPALIFAACLVIFLGDTQNILEQKAVFVVYFAIAVLAWNNWHFGKQNIGVYAYYRLSKSAAGMLPVEKKLIYLGAFLGAISASFLGLRTGAQAYAPNVKFDQWDQISGYVGIFGRYFQYALASFTLLHILRNPARFDLKSALMFFLCVNFFLPVYLGVSKGQWFSFYIASSYAHGVQYMVFLFFHSYNAKLSMPASAWHLGMKFIVTSRYLIIYILLSLVVGDLYFWHRIIPPFHFADKISDAYWTSLLTALATGVLLTHFWFDSFFWKFTNKESRNWIIERYSFLFKPTFR